MSQGYCPQEVPNGILFQAKAVTGDRCILVLLTSSVPRIMSFIRTSSGERKPFALSLETLLGFAKEAIKLSGSKAIIDWTFVLPTQDILEKG